MDLPHFLCIEQRRDSFDQLCEIDPLDNVHGNRKQENLKQSSDHIKRTLESVEGEEGPLILSLYYVGFASIQHVHQLRYDIFIPLWVEILNDSIR